eukprot:720422-Ditylum_brightwellii.AAC.1
MLTLQVAIPEQSSPEYKKIQESVNEMAKDIQNKVLSAARAESKSLLGVDKANSKVNTGTLVNLLESIKQFKNKKGE